MQEELEYGGKVFTIQSHVVHGAVGNRAAAFALMLLGFETDILNSVSLSNHPMYKAGFKGTKFKGEELLTLVEGLGANGILATYTHILTGYCADASFLRAILQVVKQLKEINKDICFFCDPVMGDNGRIYVPEELVSIYKNEICKMATVLTPNQFECELLTDIKIVTQQDALRACNILHGMGVRTVIITSAKLASEDDTKSDKSLISLFASNMLSQKQQNSETDEAKRSKQEAQQEIFRVDMEFLEDTFYGTGDLIAALLLAWTYRHPDNLAIALEKACATMKGITHITHEANIEGTNPYKEILIVQGRKHIMHPSIDVPGAYRAYKVEI